MVFNSIDEAIAYVENAIPGVLNECSYDMEEIMRNEIMEQVYRANSPNVYSRTGQLMDSPQMVNINNNSVTMEFTDNGSWNSVFPPYQHMFPLQLFEEGKVWDKGTNTMIGLYKYMSPTNIMDSSVNKCETEIPQKFKQYLISRGIPIE